MSQYDQYPPDQGRPNIPNYLVHAILVTLCCCLPFGIASIVFAAQVNGKLQAGDVTGARIASDNAKKWAWIGFGVGLPLQLVVAALQIWLQTQQQGGGFR